MYRDILRHLREATHWKRRQCWWAGKWALHHNNAPAYWSHLVDEHLARHNVTCAFATTISRLPQLLLLSTIERAPERTMICYLWWGWGGYDDSAEWGHKECPAQVLQTVVLLLAKVRTCWSKVLRRWCVTELPITPSTEVIALFLELTDYTCIVTLVHSSLETHT
jgi:hypothetical protein